MKKRSKRPLKTLQPMSAEDVLKFDCEDGWTENAPLKRKATLMGIAAAKVAKWRMAKSLETLRSQINVLAPHRKTASDGGIGDPAHQAKGSASDHNPWIVNGGIGIVTARDFTHDPKGGCDAEKLAASLAASRDPRVKYVIWNSRIMNSTKQAATPAWSWRPYTGKNKHTKHVHISVKASKSQYDGTALWTIEIS
jgi:hypothetical protein